MAAALVENETLSKPRAQRYAGWSERPRKEDQVGCRKPRDPRGASHVGRVEPLPGVRSPGVARRTRQPGHLDLRVLTRMPDVSNAASPPRPHARRLRDRPVLPRRRDRFWSPAGESALAPGPGAVRPTRRRRRDRAIPDSGTYRFHGGHRLWAAPEVPAITYAPDDHPCAVTTGDDGLTIRAPVDAAGLIKDVSVESRGRPAPRRSSPRQCRTPTDPGCRLGYHPVPAGRRRADSHRHRRRR